MKTDETSVNIQEFAYQPQPKLPSVYRYFQNYRVYFLSGFINCWKTHASFRALS